MKILFAAFLCLGTSLFAQSAKHPFTFEDMMKLNRVQEPAPSPDGKWVVFAAEDVDLNANTKISHLWIVPAAGGESKRLNETPNHEERPRFSPDGKKLIWTSKATDPTQIWMCEFNSDSGAIVGKPHQVTNISSGADGAIWSPDGKNIVFVSEVYPDCKDDACNKQRDEELKKSKVKAKIFTRLFYRHWNAFTEFKRSHLFAISSDANANLTALSSQVSQEANDRSTALSGQASPSQNSNYASEPRDLTPGDHDVPPFHLGGQDMYAISPDGEELAYTSNIDEVEATSTNKEIFVVSLSGGTPKKISTSPGADTTPLYSPDGKYLAWRSQARAGFESDKWRLFVQDRQSGKTRDLTEKFDRSVGSLAWDDQDKIWFAYEEHGQSFIGTADVRSQSDVQVSPAWPRHDTHADDLVIADRVVFFTQMSAMAPNEIWSFGVPGHDSPGKKELSAVTHMNDALLSQIGMQPLESFTFKGRE